MGTVYSISVLFHNFILELDEKIRGLPDKIPVYMRNLVSSKGKFVVYQKGDQMRVPGNILQNPIKYWSANHIAMIGKFIYNDTNKCGIGKNKTKKQKLFKGELTGTVISPPIALNYPAIPARRIPKANIGFLLKLDYNIEGIPKKIAVGVEFYDYPPEIKVGDKVRVFGKIYYFYLDTWEAEHFGMLASRLYNETTQSGL